MGKRVLIAPLDWGLGHTARCIPIIKELLLQGHELIFAGTKKQFDFISIHKLNIKHVELFSYDVEYAKHLPQWIKIGSQINKLKTKIKAEHTWLENFINSEKIDVIISDNRYGLHSKKVHSVFLGHQLFIKSPLLQKKLNRIHASYINKFDECWIPDSDELNLSGDLSKNTEISIPIKRIGILSRFKKNTNTAHKEFDILILLSGTEPQRSILENKLIAQLSQTKLKIALVKGSSSFKLNMHSNIKVFNLLDSDALKTLIEASDIIICRSGYSSIMDLINFQKKIIFIPTPGQTEQEYLAKHLKKLYGFAFLKQNNLDTLVKYITHTQIKPINVPTTGKLAIKI